MTRGEGPNPAANELAQATGQNVNQEAALIAGQRGASANPALAARTAAMAGTGAEQTAAGQAATLESQQQIAAQQNLAALSGQQVNQAQGATTALNTAQQNEQGILQNANTGTNNAAVGMQSNINNVNAANNKAVLGGITSALSGVSGGLFAEGGEVTHHGKHKLEFIHKMAKMGLEHFDVGGSVEEGQDSLRKAFKYKAPSASTAPAEAAPSPSPSPAPAASSNYSEADRVKATQDYNKKMYGDYAEGGIAANPLISAITSPPGGALVPAPQYNQLQSVGGPQIDNGSADSGPSIGDQMKSGFKAGQDWKSNHPTFGSSNAVSDASGVSGGAMDAGVGSNLASAGEAFAAKGGEIWNLMPHEHASYSANHFKQYFSKGGESKSVPAMVSPGEIYLDPEAVERVKHGADPLKEGMRVPGKPKVKGDSLKNDIVPATLKEGGVVIDRKNVGNSNKARLFVLKSLKATGKHMKKPMGMK